MSDEATRDKNWLRYHTSEESWKSGQNSNRVPPQQKSNYRYDTLFVDKVTNELEFDEYRLQNLKMYSH